ncbi:hypothetical protein ACWEF6_02900 [Amycolatopsis sp. NPDC004772]
MSALGDSLRELAELVDNDQHLAAIFERSSYGTHLVSGDASLFDTFADRFGRRQTTSGGDSYVVSEGHVGAVKVWCQARELDYHRASEAS